jgi:hypothetical protein
MSSSRSKQRLVRRIAPVALTLQFLAVLALPIALSCCLDMTAEAATSGSTRARHHGPVSDADQTANTCPHHEQVVPPTGDSNRTDTGCRYLDALVMALTGLIGVTELHPGFSQSLTPLAVVSPVTVDLVDTIRPVEFPPPRA